MKDFERQTSESKENISKEDTTEKNSLLKNLVIAMLCMICFFALLSITKVVLSIVITFGLVIIVGFGFYKLVDYLSKKRFFSSDKPEDAKSE